MYRKQSSNTYGRQACREYHDKFMFRQ